MWSPKLFKLIRGTPLGRLAERKAEVVKNTNPDRIRVENVRSLFNLSRSWAEKLCELAVNDGILERRIGLRCPNPECNRIIESVAVADDVPSKITCYVCEASGRESVFFSDELEKVVYYKLVRKNGRG